MRTIFYGDKIRQISNLVFITSIIIALFITSILDAGLSLEESFKYFPIELMPTPYISLMWYIILILLITYGLFQNSTKQATNPLLRIIGPHTSIAFSLIATWMLITQLYDIQNLDFLFLTASLYKLTKSLRYINSRNKKLGQKEYLMVYIPISAAAGWIHILTIFSVASALKYTPINNFGLSETLVGALLLMSSTIIIAVNNLHNRTNIFYNAPVVWSLALIIIANIINNRNYTLATCTILCLIMLLSTLLMASNNKPKQKNIFKK